MHNSSDQPPPDLVDVVPQIVERLRSGSPVCLSDGQRCAILANATFAPEGATWRQLQNGSGGALLLRDMTSALDFVSTPSPLARRLMRKCWPGEVRLALSQGMDKRLIEQLPPIVRQTIENDRGFSLCVPNSVVLRDVLEQVEFPLVKMNRKLAAGTEPSELTVFRSDSESVNTEAEIQIDGHHWELVTAAGLTSEEVSHMLIERILFVCTGNTCRSPMAEGVFRHMLAERLRCSDSDLSQKGFDVSSAGLSASPGLPASPESVDLCQSYGVDLTGHSSQPLTEALLLESDRIYTMTVGHRDAILSNFPQLEDDVRLLSPSNEDVSDPMGWGITAYEQSLREIAESVKTIVDELAASHEAHP